MMNNKISLTGKWHGICYDLDGQKKFDFNGSVPGCVHTDLSNNVIDYDIFYRDMAEKCQWIENMNWEYTHSFTIAEKYPTAELVFEGLDVYCDVFLNGYKLGKCDNMFISHSFDISKFLHIGENVVTVHFYSPISAVKDKPNLDGAFSPERLHTRRMQCTYGWDWVSRLVTCGIYRDVYIKVNDGFSIENIYVYTHSIEENFATIGVEVELTNVSKEELIDLEILTPKNECVYKKKYTIESNTLKDYINIENAELWYPNGYGEQPLYTLKIGNKTERFGVRKVDVLQDKDEIGSKYYEKCLELKETPSAKEYDQNIEFSGFTLVINNIPIMCKGANWVPCEPFPSEESEEKITRLLTLAKDAGFNMIRVWGGGLFEKQHFYDECDRLGLTVTQDFLMACGNYPEKDCEFIEQLQKEAKYAALTLRNHPSLVWWSGDNENAIMGYDEADDYKGKTAYYSGIQPMLDKWDPNRIAFPSSPYGGKFYASKTVGTTHNTQFLSYIFDYIENTDMSDYKEYFSAYSARFISEEPTMGAVALPTLKKIMTDDDIYNKRDMWIYHTKGNPALKTEIFDYIRMFAKKVLGNFTNGKDRLFKLKYIQYEWMRISFENVRRNKGFCNGVVYWMLNDCWPAAAGWALIDYFCLPKASYYSFKRCAKDVVASIYNSENRYSVAISNDSFEKQKTDLSVYLVSGDKAETLMQETVVLDENAVKFLEIPLLDNLMDNQIIVCDISTEQQSDRAFYKKGLLHIGETNSVKILSSTNNSITITSDVYVHAVELEGEMIFNDNYFSLMPGETKTICFEKINGDSDCTITGYTIA